MFSNYLKVALRNLLRHKVYSLINVLGLAVGLACCIVILLWVRFNLSFESFHRNAHRICWLYEHQEFGDLGTQYFSGTMPAMGPALQEDFPEVENFCRFYWAWGGFVARYGVKMHNIEAALYTDHSVFQVFSFPLLKGEPASALRKPNSLVVSEDVAIRLFGDEDPLGQVVIHDGESYTVTGVMKNLPRNSHLQFEILISFSSLENRPPWGKGHWDNNCLYTYLLLKQGASRLALEQKMQDFLQIHLGETSKYYKLLLMPLKDIRLHSPTDYGKGPSELHIYLFSWIALAVLLLACINFINLSTARASERALEVGLRKALGASRSVIARQFLGETALMATLAFLVAIILVELTLPMLNLRLGTRLEFGYMSDWKLTFSLIAGTLTVGLLAGSYPAAVVSSFQPSAVLKGDGHSRLVKLVLRRVLVIFQFVISIFLITCTLFVAGQWKYMRNKDLGLNAGQVVCLPVNPDIPVRYETFRNALLRYPAIAAVTAVNDQLWNPIWASDLHYEGNSRNKNQSIMVSNLWVDHDFIPFFGLELLAGRGFSKEIPTDQQGYVINETLAGNIGWSPEEAVGKQVSVNVDNFGPVIGVVRDFHLESVARQIEPLILIFGPKSLRCVMVRTKSGSLTQALEFIKLKWQDHFPDRPFAYTFLDQEFARKYENYEQQTLIIGTFTLLAVLLACLGLLGLISFAAQRRSKEIGIRKVMGASVSQIVLLLSKEFFLLLGIAALIAWPVAWYAMDRWLRNFAYRIELDVWTFVLAGLLALVIAAVTVSFQAVKAATTDPVKALRYE